MICCHMLLRVDTPKGSTRTLKHKRYLKISMNSNWTKKKEKTEKAFIKIYYMDMRSPLSKIQIFRMNGLKCFILPFLRALMMNFVAFIFSGVSQRGFRCISET